MSRINIQSSRGLVDLRPVAGRKGDRGEGGPGSDVTAAEIEAVKGEAEDARDAAVTAQLAAEAAAGATKVDRVVTATVSGGTYTADLTLADTFVLNLTADSTFAVSGLSVGRSFLVQVNQDSTGGRTLTLPSSGGTVSLGTTANTFETLIYRSNDGSELIAHQASGGPFALPFSPGHLTDQIAWFDASDPAGDPNDSIDLWVNRWTERNVGYPTAASQPKLQVINGVEVLRFDGANDRFLTIDGSFVTAAWNGAPYSQPGTVAALVKTPGPTTATVPIFAGSGTADWYVKVLGSGSGSYWNLYGGADLVSTVADDHEWTVVVAVINGASSKFRIDGVETVGNAGTTTSSGLKIGSNSTSAIHGAFDIQSYIQVNHAADATEIGKIEAYLNAKRDALIGS